MPKRSIAYENMRHALLRAVGSIPPGHVVEVGVLASSLNIPARHAAHILSRLTADEADLVPWHRVVPKGGVFRPAERRIARESEQLRRLCLERVAGADTGRLALTDDCLWQPDDRHRNTIWADEEPPATTPDP